MRIWLFFKLDTDLFSTSINSILSDKKGPIWILLSLDEFQVIRKSALVSTGSPWSFCTESGRSSWMYCLFRCMFCCFSKNARSSSSSSFKCAPCRIHSKSSSSYYSRSSSSISSARTFAYPRTDQPKRTRQIIVVPGGDHGHFPRWNQHLFAFDLWGGAPILPCFHICDVLLFHQTIVMSASISGVAMYSIIVLESSSNSSLASSGNLAFMSSSSWTGSIC